MTKRTEELKRNWTKGSMPPSNYAGWHEWAEAQELHGLKQGNCEKCGRYVFPQEMNLGACSDAVECAQFVKKHGKLSLAPLF
jgi:uncharacterized OB-fold protein